ncbi:hypothetical protein [Novosphingobium sp. Gsoil 351]|uniref:hypothetical protein n=1 Tax=Novosphingobium sp. Gsoil 351 TaxID=2675225 RepID=UPI00351B57C2
MALSITSRPELVAMLLPGVTVTGGPDPTLPSPPQAASMLAETAADTLPTSV